MRESQERVAQWMRKFATEVRTEPSIPTQDVRYLRAQLSLEECLEKIRALGFSATVSWNAHSGHEFELEETHSPDLCGVADGVADSMVVDLGTAAAFGFDAEKVFNEVMRSNESKLWTAAEWVKRTDISLTGYCAICRHDMSFCVCDVDVNNPERHIIVRRHDGKIIKSPSYSPAEIAKNLK